MHKSKNVNKMEVVTFYSIIVMYIQVQRIIRTFFWGCDGFLYVAVAQNLAEVRFMSSK